ncbi:SLATT domain-containing protein [Streptomyces sp. NBC_01615]|uniref:SLATT domain-containing protein n=1 Tax=Streptomyces sp. NBC_01615 TaxID=2975898 RepID=UPI003862FD0F
MSWNWQTISVVCLGFSVTLATAFSGYYKYRERSYFLRQTADAIQEEANALALGVGEYREFSQAQEDQALAKFTQRVETLRNEQRRREQQLDQLADQAAPPTPPPTL